LTLVVSPGPTEDGMRTGADRARSGPDLTWLPVAWVSETC